MRNSEEVAVEVSKYVAMAEAKADLAVPLIVKPYLAAPARRSLIARLATSEGSLNMSSSSTSSGLLNRRGKFDPALMLSLED